MELQISDDLMRQITTEMERSLETKSKLFAQRAMRFIDYLRAGHDILQYADWLKDNYGHLGPGTRGNYVSAARNRVEWLYRDSPFAYELQRSPGALPLDTITRNLRHPPKERVSDTKRRRARRIMSPDEVRSLLAMLYKIDPVMYAVGLALKESGARISEILRVQLKNCDRVRKTSNGRSVEVVEFSVVTKGDRVQRKDISVAAFEEIVRICGSTEYLIEEVLRNQARQPVLDEEGNEIRRAPTRIKVTKTFARAGRKLGWARKVSPHDLRHTFVTEWARKGGVAVAMYMAGHADPATTMIYTDLEEIRDMSSASHDDEEWEKLQSQIRDSGE